MFSVYYRQKPDNGNIFQSANYDVHKCLYMPVSSFVSCDTCAQL